MHRAKTNTGWPTHLIAGSTQQGPQTGSADTVGVEEGFGLAAVRGLTDSRVTHPESAELP